MAPKPIFILLGKHLSSCHMPGTSITESGITVSTDKHPGEIIHFFRIDSDAGRKQLDMIGLRCCDCLIFYTKETEQGEMLCFLELKAAGFKDAKIQILIALQNVKSLLTANHIQSVTFRACICMRHQAPQGYLKHLEELKRVFGKENVLPKFGVKHYKELGEFLRKQVT